MRYPGDAPPTPDLSMLAPDLWRLEGTDPSSGIRYVRLLLLGKADQSPSEPAGAQKPTLVAMGPTVPQPDLSRPTLTGQCTQDASGGLHFELFANFGAVTDVAFYPPWRRTKPDEQTPPRMPRVQVTLDFLGYTRVKPMRRAFEQVVAPGPEQLRYLNPGRTSPNLEPPAWFFQYLRSLPRLRLTAPLPASLGQQQTRGAEFVVTPWLDRLHTESLCAASGA